VKLPAGRDNRIELREPLQGGVRSIPDRLSAELRVLTRGQDLSPVAVLRTRRIERHLRDSDGRDLAVVADDTVSAERVGENRPESSWREVEVELIDGDVQLLDDVQVQLEAAGARPSAASSKLARVLADRLSDRWVSDDVSRHGFAGAVVVHHLRGQVDALIRLDRSVRRYEPDAVHQMRVATRRLRSALATYRVLFDSTRTDPLRSELAWLAAALGAPRDAEVLRDRLRGAVSELPEDLILGPISKGIELELGERHRTAHAALEQALDQDRYLALLDALDDVLEHPPFTGRAERPARRELPRLVARSCKRVDREAEAAAQASTQTDRELHVHEVRKAAKRARYAAESATVVFGKPAKRLAVRMERVQEILGQHQDGVVARQSIRDLAFAATAAGENGFTFGLLHAREAKLAVAAQHAYPKALRAAGAKRARRWLMQDPTTIEKP
jgi:CHAD domain-containing protein